MWKHEKINQNTVSSPFLIAYLNSILFLVVSSDSEIPTDVGVEKCSLFGFLLFRPRIKREFVVPMWRIPSVYLDEQSLTGLFFCGDGNIYFFFPGERVLTEFVSVPCNTKYVKPMKYAACYSFLIFLSASLLFLWKYTCYFLELLTFENAKGSAEAKVSCVTNPKRIHTKQFCKCAFWMSLFTVCQCARPLPAPSSSMNNLPVYT